MSNPAPGALELVRGFVNTFDADEGTDDIDTPAKLQSWLTANGLLAEGAEVARADQERAVAVRDALRATLLAHHGHPAPIADDVLAEASQRAKLRVLFDEGGVPRLETGAAGVDGAIGRLLTIAHESDREGQWVRLKICPADDCQWAFYDRSRNRSATWCDMKVCGNRHKVREYRERRLRGTTG